VLRNGWTWWACNARCFSGGVRGFGHKAKLLKELYYNVYQENWCPGIEVSNT
jgi:hypothetical protein